MTKGGRGIRTPREGCRRQSWSTAEWHRVRGWLDVKEFDVGVALLLARGFALDLLGALPPRLVSRGTVRRLIPGGAKGDGFRAGVDRSGA
jgi:hypothetical protein